MSETIHYLQWLSGEQAPCGSAPHYSQSFNSSFNYYMAPIHYEVSHSEARDLILKAIRSFERVREITASEEAMAFEFRSRVFRFVDDVDVYLPQSSPIIYMRSCSRIGHYDFGVNRKRLQQITDRFYNSLSR